MNRIILIGNGFDLAHGLKTSYADFINWYWYKWGEKLRGTYTKSLDDRLCSCEIKEDSGMSYLSFPWNGSYYIKENPFLPWDNNLVADVARTDTKIFKFTYKDKFFQEICNSVETKGWVDIECVFYDYLSHKSQYSVETKIANDDLDYLRNNLITYLSDIQKDITDGMVDDKRKKTMIEPFAISDISIEGLSNLYLKREFELANSDGSKCYPNQILLLNFNYTTLADLYLPKSNKYIVNHIHGVLSNPDSIIFGYGDELDENYKTIVNKNDNEYLRNIKSIKYLESPNYRNLLKFIESSKYQIYIMGHSCGNSDRTLLNTLFEHKNCVSIKPFYHKKSDGSDNYIELVQNISRNFTDMKLMRDRVVNKTFCEPLS